MNKSVIIYGNGELAQLVFQMNQNEQIGTIAAYTADRAYLNCDQFLGSPLIPFETIADAFPSDQYDMLVAIGYKRMRDRALLIKRAREKGYTLINWISKRALINQPCEMGVNNIIDGGIYIGAETKLGDNNVIRPNAYFGHETQMGNHNYIAPGVNIGGGCRIGNLCYIGIGATVIDQRNLADETLIGAGALMLHHSEPFSKYLGVPARKSGTHEKTGICIGV
jgi:UDP-N-acetylbacillosamine N-acetyltransferase